MIKISTGDIKKKRLYILVFLKSHSVDLKLLPYQNSYIFQKSSVKAIFLVKGAYPPPKALSPLRTNDAGFISPFRYNEIMFLYNNALFKDCVIHIKRMKNTGVVFVRSINNRNPLMFRPLNPV